MLAIKIFQIDAFASETFRGNPAAVCLLPHWLDDKTLQLIAAENNLSETAFVVPTEAAGTEEAPLTLRWFTPKYEVPLCGHATLATAFVLFNELAGELAEHFANAQEIAFSSKSGLLKVAKRKQLLELNFPRIEYRALEQDQWPQLLVDGLGIMPLEIYQGVSADKYLVVFQDHDQVVSLAPDMAKLTQLHPYGVITTAPALEYDCVSRFFLPSFDVQEDPVTGSAHCFIAPYWGERLEKSQILARQVSARSGELHCQLVADRVLIAGQAVKYLAGEIYIPSQG